MGPNLMNRHLSFFPIAFSIGTIIATASMAVAQQQSFNVVTRGPGRLLQGEKVAAVTDAGEILTVLTTQNGKYWVQTAKGATGWLDQVGVVPMKSAGPIYDQLIRRNPRDPKNYERRAMIWLAAGQTDKLLADYSTAIRLGSREPTVYLNRGIHLATQGQYAQAIADYDQAERLGLKEAYLYVNRGVAHFAANQHDKATSDFSTAIKLGEKTYSIYINRASAYRAAGEEIKAIDDLAEAIRLEPENPAGYHQRGLVWQAMEKFDKAIADFDQAIQRDPKYIPAYSSRGFAWFLQDEPKKAIPEFDQVLRLNPKSAVAYNNRGFNKQLVGKYGEALTDYDQAIQLAPEYILAWQNKAWLLATCPDDAVRNGKQAFAAASKACELGKWEDWSDLKSLAAAYAASQDFKQAVKWQTKVLEKAPEDAKPEEQRVLGLYNSNTPYSDPDDTDG